MKTVHSSYCGVCRPSEECSFPREVHCPNIASNCYKAYRNKRVFAMDCINSVMLEQMGGKLNSCIHLNSGDILCACEDDFCNVRDFDIEHLLIRPINSTSVNILPMFVYVILFVLFF
ncbi:hypothetical protein M3Y97_01137100 [Aphelenchoides bicaudatus]|nr:hypothetical protein M3Y97_01137100 [Aphelenchoides bicaudatus]